jgi:hypothetical protein
VPNPRYPAEVQERAYDRDKGEQLKVISIAQNLIPELVFNGAPGAIDGLPVVTPDGIVLGGNGRTMALQLHYADGGEVARRFLEEHARQFGFSRRQVQMQKDPVVVRVIDVPPASDPSYKRSLQELVRLLNVPLLKSLDSRSEAVAEGRRINDEVLEILSIALQGDVTLLQYLSRPESRTLANALRRSGIISDRNAVRMLAPTGDSFSDEGKRFVERLLIGTLLPDADLIDRLDGHVRESIARSAPWWLSAGAAGEDWDLRPAFRAAASDLVAMKREQARSVDAFLRQQRMGEQAAVQGVPLGETILRLLVEHGAQPTVLSRVAQKFAELSRLHPSSQGGLFASVKLSPADALRQAVQVG